MRNHKHPSYLLFRSLLVAVVALLACATPTLSQQLDSGYIDQLDYRHIGPVGNRLISVAGIAGDPMVYYVGAASGGIWKTTDGGLNWKPLFDDKEVHSIGALAVAPSDRHVIYAGTGESFIRSNVSIGNGVWRSTDGGESWEHLGLDKTGRISRIVVHPDNPDVAYVAALGHAYAPQPERGVYRTMDGGKSWEKVLFVDEETGVSDIAMHPENPRILFAGAWQLKLRTWTRYSGGPGSGVFMSKDGGDSWKRLEGNGLPESPVGKIALAMTPAQPERVYALIETGDGTPIELEGEPSQSGELWRSDDLGKNWRLVNSNRDLGGRQAYYTRCAASPDNANEIYFMWADFSRSIDGGRTAETMEPGPNWDHHEIWIDPTNGDRMIVVGDGGLSISENRGKSWHRVQLPVAQLYHVTTDTKTPYNVLTNRQDGPSMKGPSRSRTGGMFGPGFIPTGLWHDVGGGESGFATADPENPDIVWSSASGFGPLGGIVTRYNEKTGQYRQVEVWPEFPAGHPAKDVKYRFQWTFPLLISPHDHNTVYVTSQHVHRTTNGGQSWEVISPDLTLDEEDKQGFSGGLTGDNIAVEYFNVIYAFDESPVQEGLFWAGANDGLVHISRDGGESWTNVTDNIPGLPQYGVVRNIDASKYEAGKAYLTIEFHQVGNFDPYVYKTEDYGQSWTKITDGIDDSNLSYVRNIREDPVREGLLYLGTENKLYVSFNDGEQWQPFMSNLPPAPMYWLDIPEHFNDLVVGTYGRGIWILDDITPLQQLTPEVAEQPVHLFDPKPAYRFRPVSQIMQFFPEPSFGEDPPYGASINYWLQEENDSVKLHITNAAGDTVRTLEHQGKPGINRVWWDLNGEKTEKLVLRTKPQYADWVALDENRSREAPSLFGEFSVLLPPGEYTVRLSAGGESQSQTLEVLKDPHSEGSLEDIAAQTEMVKELHADMNTLANLINEVELVRRQVLDMQNMLAVKEDGKELLQAAKALDSTLVAYEGQLIQLKMTGHGQDGVRYPAKLASRISYLANAVSTADFPPTDQQREVHQLLQQRLEQYQQEWEALQSGAIREFTQMLQEKRVGPIVTKKEMGEE